MNLKYEPSSEHGRREGRVRAGGASAGAVVHEQGLPDLIRGNFFSLRSGSFSFRICLSSFDLASGLFFFAI